MFKKMNFGKNPEGKKYNFNMVPLSLGEFRIAFAGDSVSEGSYGSTPEQMKKMPFEERF